MKRSEAREAAFLYLYQRTVREDTMEELISAANEAENEELRLNAFARQLVLLCDEKTEELDNIIERHLDRWKLNRLPRLTLAALRMATCELLFNPDVPTPVTVNETVELLKKYASEQDALFANGVLGAIVATEQPAKNESAAESESDADASAQEE